jgi:PAS domain S-box-containing protein
MMKNIADIIGYSKNLKLLYVEDNQLAREATLAVFEEFFEEVIVGVDGQDGFEQYTKESVDMIITDINMPRLNGLEMTKKIRELDKDIPILVLSAYNESGFFMDSIKLGVDGYLLKPIDLSQFVEALKKIVEKLKIISEVYLLQQYQDVTDISTIISKTDADGKITYVNEAYCKLSEYSCEELINKNHNIFKYPNTDPKIYQDLWDTIKNKKTIWKGILKNRSKYGHTFYIETAIKPVLNMNGEIVEYISIKNDITNTMDQRKRLVDITKNSQEYIVILVKIENFDDIEKYYGQDLSTELEEKFRNILLKYIGEKLPFKEIFLLGDGEYALTKEKSECKSSDRELENALLSAQQKINDAVIELDGFAYDISVIISLSHGDNSYENAKYGLKELEKTKQNFIFANNLIELERKEAQNNLNTLKMIKDALETDQIVAYFQPIIDNQTQEISKYETLVRLVTQSKKVLPPLYFLEIAKKGKYYYQITQKVLEQAFTVLRNCDKEISINLSAIDIEKQRTQIYILELLKEHKEHAHRVIFELLEDEEMKDFRIIKKFIVSVKKYGVKIAIDDFGSGYSNFERLLDYQPDIIKIDGGLIKNIEHDPYSFNVVETIVNFAKKQNIQTVGEYVENENIYKILHDLGVDFSQGYHFGKPQPL